eukprot:6408571-Prymnesium_polylepis.2
MVGHGHMGCTQATVVQLGAGATVQLRNSYCTPFESNHTLAGGTPEEPETAPRRRLPDRFRFSRRENTSRHQFSFVFFSHPRHLAPHAQRSSNSRQHAPHTAQRQPPHASASRLATWRQRPRAVLRPAPRISFGERGRTLSRPASRAGSRPLSRCSRMALVAHAREMLGIRTPQLAAHRSGATNESPRLLRFPRAHTHTRPQSPAAHENAEERSAPAVLQGPREAHRYSSWRWTGRHKQTPRALSRSGLQWRYGGIAGAHEGGASACGARRNTCSRWTETRARAPRRYRWGGVLPDDCHGACDRAGRVGLRCCGRERLDRSE